MRHRGLFLAAVVIVAVAGLALAGWLFTGREPRLPASARAALAQAVVSSDGGAGRLKLLEAERIGPDFAVIYRVGGMAGTALLVGDEETWSVQGAPNPGALVPPPGTQVGAVSLVADGLQVVFMGIPDRRVARVAVRFPSDGTVLNASRRRGYAIAWRPAGQALMSFDVETYDAKGKRLNP